MTTDKTKSLISILNEFDNDQSLTSGLAVRLLRKSLNFTLKDVQALTGIRETHLSAIENDAYELTKKNAEKIAASLGVHPSIILFPEGYSKSSEIKKIEAKAKLLLKKKS